MSESTPSRYVVGIDLGTTNSAVAWVDTAESPWRVQTLAIPQLVAPGQVEARDNLPSFHYQPAGGEFPAGSLRLPWSREEPEYAVGFFARDHGTLVPGRLISSAKSWLSHSGVDRTAELLPWHGAPDVDRLSPVEASSRYLAHIRAAWDHQFPEHPLSGQDVVLTLPASFDEVARELTVKAAQQAGLPRVVLIEEPQAAFYAWIYLNAQGWEQHVSPGQKILVCDVGGGTSDFTLIRVRRGEGNKVQFHRVAVGEHLILGGDNFDLALAHHLERKLTGDGKLEPRQWGVLVRTCRQVKEALLGERPPERFNVHLPGTGARLLGGGLQVEVTREEAEQVLLDGFLPKVGLDDRPSTRRSGFQEFGLPYAPDAAITKYLAAFLSAHRHVALDDVEAPADHDPARPDIVLFNGGVFNSDAIRQRLIDVLLSWFQGPGGSWQPQVLQNDRLDLAVARGAAYYGMVRRGEGVRIAAGLARTYYIGVESEPPVAVCLVPAGMEPGSEVDLTQTTFHLRVSQPIEFPLYVSSTRLTDRPGELVPFDREQMTPLPPIRTVLRSRKAGEFEEIPVHLRARLTEIGTLDLWCSEAEGRRSWKLLFDIRSATQTDVSAHDALAERQGFVDEATWQQCREIIDSTFGPAATEKPATVVKRLSAALEMERDEWPSSLLRNMWEALMEVEPGRRKSEAHEARWLNLLGFSLRPGYGLAVDDWRVAETWKALHGKLVHPSPMCRAEWWVFWRRIGGGLESGQQQALATPLLSLIRQTHRQRTSGRGKGAEFSSSTHEEAEVWRLLGSLELLPVNTKAEIGGILVDLLQRPKGEAVRPAVTWALGRVGSRVPLYGPLNGVVPAETAGEWIRLLLKLDQDDRVGQLCLMQLARRTEDRYRDIPDKLRERVVDWLERANAPAHFIQLVQEGGTLEVEEKGLVFGESLPKGLRMK